MELNDILEKLSLPQDLTRRGFLKAASAAAALGLLNDARAKNGVRPYVILETAKGLHHRRPQSVRCLPPL